jgi:putative zinc finger/helix-turn-helix YgiT family protein
MKTATNSNMCPECGRGQLHEKSGVYETTFSDGDESRPLKVTNMKWLECDECGEVILDDSAMDQVERARYNELDLLSPKEIQEIRCSLGKTQQEMATLLAVGSKTYCRWEGGNFYQTRHNDRILRYIRRIQFECPEALIILEELAEGIESAQPLAKNPRSCSSQNWFGPSLSDHSRHIFHDKRVGPTVCS